MNAFVSKEELALLPANRISYPEHYAEAQSQRSSQGLFARIRAWIARRLACWRSWVSCPTASWPISA